VNTNKELNFWNQKIVYDITKFTTTDYVGYISCIIWFIGCNFRCLYCYNDNIVYTKRGKYDFKEIFQFLKSRVGLLDSVVLSGGEATIHNLIPLCKEIKELGFKIKLDTNGSNFEQIKKLVELNLIDYIAIDFKSPKDKFKDLVNSCVYDTIIKTIQYLINIDFDFELRTTVNTKLLDENDINSIIKEIVFLGYKKTYYIQNFLETSSNIGNIEKGRDLDKSLINSGTLAVQYRN
jgi:pyruvate formate lyase activating enzyme